MKSKPIQRRTFLKSSLIASISLTFIPSIFGCDNRILDYSIQLNVPTKLFDGKKCWSHPRAGIVPKLGQQGNPRVVITMNNLDLSGSDVFRGMFELFTDDLGESWTEPVELKTMAPRFEMIDGINRPVAASDFWPKWHEASNTLLGTGHTVVYTHNWKVRNPRPRSTAYSVYNLESGKWAEWKKLKMPNDINFMNAGAGCAQRFDLEDGTILLPIYIRPLEKNMRVRVCKCSFDGETLKYLSHGNILELNDETRGLGEPSLTRFKGDFFMTIRNDKKSFVTRSNDGMNFEEIQPWKFDDGTDLGSYNTQQHWISRADGLFLIYTRRGANNDHVFRHRVPLFIAQVDPVNLCVIRATEQILVPERGARLGNFGVTEVNPNETWVTVSEWMQPDGVEKYGSNGSVFVAKIKWNI